MKPINPARRPIYVAAALGAILLTAGCAGTPDSMFANRPANLDGGVGQLLRYCSKFQNSGDLVTAAGLCERAHVLEPENPAPLMQLADIMVGMGRPENAVSAYRMVLDSAPGNIEARYALGKLYINSEQYDLAAAEFQIALRYKGRDPRLHNALGIAHGLVGAHDSALQSFEAGLKVAPKHISLRNNLGLSLVLNGRYDEGIKVLEAVTSDPGANATSHRNLQLAYGMISTANAGHAIPEAASAQADTTGADPARGPVMTAELRAAPAGEQPPPRPEDRAAKSATVPRPVEIQAEDATPGTPVPLIQNAQREEAMQRDGDVEAPIEVSVFDAAVFDSSTSGGAALDGSADETGPARRSPLRVQTATAATTDLEDSSAPSAVVGNYLTADASIDETPPAPSAPAAAEREVAAVQPLATPQLGTTTPTETGTARGYTVQLASYLSEERAMKGWTELLGAAPDLLDSFEPMVRRAELGEDRGTFYRLRTVPTTKGDADALCTELRTREIDCLVIEEVPAATDGGSQTG